MQQLKTVTRSPGQEVVESTPADIPDNGSLSDYAHQPLPQRTWSRDDFYIRVAVLHPGQPDQPIHVTLQTEYFMAGNRAPEYVALSYCWGPADGPKHSILLSHCIQGFGRASASVNGWYTIRENLFAALCQLRSIDRARRIWTDALCINQEDDGEKSAQVANIGLIFKEARRVIAWLGPASDDSDRAMEVLRNIGNQVEWNAREGYLVAKEGATDPSLADTDPDVPLLLPDRDWMSLQMLFDRDFFVRLWIRQEIGLPPAEIVAICCGSQSVPWTTFVAAALCVTFKEMPATAPSSTIMLVNRLQKIGGIFKVRRGIRGTVTPNNLRLTFAGCQCQDPKDRIYAVLQLMDPYYSSHVPLDYSKSVEQVYLDITLAYLDKNAQRPSHHGLGLLNECMYDGQWAAPSWVPNWTVAIAMDDHERISLASFPFAGLYQVQPSPIPKLTAGGVRIGVVEHLHLLNMDHNASTSQLTESICAIFSAFSDHVAGLLSTHCASAMDDFLRSLCGDWLRDFVDMGIIES
jgi:hypothetical protein